MIAFVALLGAAAAFSPPPAPSGHVSLCTARFPMCCTIRPRFHEAMLASHCTGDMASAVQREESRRSVLAGGAWLGALVLLAPASPAAAADKDDKRILEGYAAIVDLIDNWDTYAGIEPEANGDNVRRQVGTVGNKSPLLGIRKVMLRKQVDLDLMEAVNDCLTDIDSDAYSAIFADSSTSPKRGYAYMKDALKDAKRLKAAYEEMMESIGLSSAD